MKKMFFYAAALCLTAVGFASCTAEDEAFPAAVVSITEEEVAVAAEGGPISFNLTAPTNEAFSVQTPDWIEFNENGTVSRGVNSTAAYKFEVAPAESCQERTGVIRIVAASGLQDSLVVVQEGITLAVNVTEVTAPSAGGELAVSLTAAAGYQVSCPEWISMVEDPATTHVGVQTATVTFAIAENTEAGARNGEIVISCGDACGQEVKITVAQKAGLDISKMVKYSGKMVSEEYGDEYDATIGLVWDEEDPSVVTVCNLDPYFALNGLTVDAGLNYVKAQYFSDENIIKIPFQSSLNVTLNDPNYGLMDFSVGALDAPSLADATTYDHVYLQLNDDKSTITIANVLCTLVTVNGQFGGYYDAYRGGIVLTKVSE
jgi:hypothetical protein